MSSEGKKRQQSFQIVELFFDLMHGDLIRGDKCCRRVADALIAAYEDAIRWLVTSEAAFTAALKGAMNTYCARYVLRTAPELLIASREAAGAYTQISHVLREVPELEALGEAMAEELSYLTVRLETKRFARLLDLMGGAAVAYMRKAAYQHEEEKSRGILLQAEPAFWSCVTRFINSSPYISNNNQNNSNSKRERENDNIEDVSPNNKRVMRGFSEELRQAMSSPAKNSENFVMSTHSLSCVQPKNSLSNQVSPIKKTPTKNSEKTGRVLLQVNDSTMEVVEELDKTYSQKLQDVSSAHVVIDNSTDIPPIPFTQPRRKDIVVAGVDDTDTSLLGGDVNERSYFLCSKTNRYEPLAAQGFFS